MKASKTSLIILILFLSVPLFLFIRAKSQMFYQNKEPVTFNATVKRVEKGICENTADLGEGDSPCFILTVQDPDSKADAQLSVLENSSFLRDNQTPEKGDLIRINRYDQGESSEYLFAGFDRVQSYFTAGLIFVLVAIGVAGIYGLRSILALLLSFIVVVFLIIKPIIAGYDPLLVTAVGGTAMLTVMILVSHGFNRVSMVSILGAFVGIIASTTFAYLLSDWAYLTGFADETATYISLYPEFNLDMRELIVASFILGGLGVVDDATVSQVHVVNELKAANRKLSRYELYRSAMNVGASHIGSLINTLFIAYVATALPLVILLFIINSSVNELLNQESIAEEVVRTISGSIGLILSIPAATLLAVIFIDGDKTGEGHHSHSHAH